MADKSPKKAAAKRKSVAAAPKRVASTTKQTTSNNKPLFSMGTIVTLVTFILIVAVSIYISQKKTTEEAAATPEGGETTYVFTESDGIPSGIKIEPAEGEAVELQRDDKNVWGLILPTKTEANQSLAEAASTQLGAISIVKPKIDGNTADFGLDAPAFVITTTFAGGKTHILEIGDPAVTSNGYYARLDKGDIMLISLSGIDSLTQLAAFPPYLNTPTPTPLPPTATPVPASNTPAASPADVTVTPTP
jgi:plastocyanin domain-containing protein